MQDISSVSSEEELLQLRNEGKITEDEYEQLLAAMSKPPSESVATALGESPSIPVLLKVVAWIFIIGGVLACIEIVVALMNEHVNINIGVLGLFIGPGLLKLRRSWRTCALAYLVIALITIPIITLLSLVAPASEFGICIFGQPLGRAPMELVLVIAIGSFSLGAWVLWVLTRPQIRALFGLDRC